MDSKERKKIESEIVAFSYTSLGIHLLRTNTKKRKKKIEDWGNLYFEDHPECVGWSEEEKLKTAQKMLKEYSRVLKERVELSLKSDEEEDFVPGGTWDYSGSTYLPNGYEY